MTEHLTLGENTIAYDLIGEGPLVVLAHGIGDSRHSYRFVAPALAAAGYRVANVDIRGCGESSLGWDGYSRTDIAGDLVALVRHLGGPAVIIGQSISGGAATIAAATAPDADHRSHRARAVHPRAVDRPRRADAGQALPGRLHRRWRMCIVSGQLWRTGRSTSTSRARQARRLGRRAGAHRGQAERARPDEGAAGHVQDQAQPTPAPSWPTSPARSWSSRAASTPTGPTRAPRARRSSPTCPPASVSWRSSRAPVTTRTPRPPTRSSRWPCPSSPGPCPVPRAGLAPAAVGHRGRRRPGRRDRFRRDSAWACSPNGSGSRPPRSTSTSTTWPTSPTASPSWP